MNINENKELTVQSNSITLSKINFGSIYQKRVLYAIIDSVSPHLKSAVTYSLVKNNPIDINYEKCLFNEFDKVTYKARDLENSRQNYPLLRKALEELKGNTIKITNDKGDITGTSFVTKFKWLKGSDKIILTVDRELYEFLFELHKGYTLFQLKTAMSLPSIHSMKIYELIAKWRGKEKFYISIEDLRFVTDTLDKYKNNGNFKLKVLDAAKRHLDDNKDTDLRFDYEIVKKGRAIAGFNIYVVHTAKSREIKKELNSVSPNWFLPKTIQNVLESMKINVKGKTLEYLSSYFLLIKEDETKMIEQLRFWESMALKNERTVQGYVMNSVKNELNISAEEK